MNPSLTTILSIAICIDACGWLIGVIPTLFYAFKYRTLPTLGGIKLLGGGPFESLGIDAMIVTGLVYVVVSALKFLAAYWLSNSKMDGAVLQLILLGLSAIFWYGFALPFGPPVGVIQVVLLALIWRTLL